MSDPRKDDWFKKPPPLDESLAYELGYEAPDDGSWNKGHWERDTFAYVPQFSDE